MAGNGVSLGEPGQREFDIGPRRILGTRRRSAPFEPVADRLDSPSRPDEPGTFLPFGHARRNDPRAIFQMIDGDHPVVESHDHIGNRELIETRSGQSLDVMAKVVREKPGRSALKRGKSGDRFRRPLAEPLPKPSERVGRSNHLVRKSGTNEPKIPFSAHDPFEGGGCEEAVTPEFRVEPRAVEEQNAPRTGEPSEPHVGPDRNGDLVN